MDCLYLMQFFERKWFLEHLRKTEDTSHHGRLQVTKILLTLLYMWRDKIAPPSVFFYIYITQKWYHVDP